jgi:hypothetical protein
MKMVGSEKKEGAATARQHAPIQSRRHSPTIFALEDQDLSIILLFRREGSGLLRTSPLSEPVPPGKPRWCHAAVARTSCWEPKARLLYTIRS